MQYSKYFIGFFLISVTGCVTPKVWVLERRENSGVIAYENYNPSGDNNRRIRNLIHCKNFKMTANPIYTVGYEAPSYYVSPNYITPIGGGPIQRGEYHYKCLDSANLSLANVEAKQSMSSDDCIKSCEDMRLRRELAYWISIDECARRICER